MMEEVYVAQPDGFFDPDHPEKVYRLRKALYKLKQASRVWYNEFSKFLTLKGFTKGTIDPTLFMIRYGEDILLVQIYVDDIIFGSTNPKDTKHFEKLMHCRFEMSLMREMTFFLGLQIHQSPCGIFINQSKYALEILHKHGIEKGQSIGTPMAMKPKLDADLTGNPIDQTDYHSKIRSLMYLTSSRPDIVQALFQMLITPDALILAKSTSGRIQFLGVKLVSWMSKMQNCTVMSSTEAEYVALSACCAQVMWMRTQLQDYGFNYNKIPLYCDSQLAINRRDLLKDTPQLEIAVLRYDGDECDKEIMPTKIELTLEQSQQGVSNDVLKISCIPSRLCDVELHLIALNTKLQVFYALSDDYVPSLKVDSGINAAGLSVIAAGSRLMLLGKDDSDAKELKKLLYVFNDVRVIVNAVVAAAKLPILNPNEFDLWKMRIEQYFLMTNYSLWEVILNGDSPTPTKIIDGVVQVIAPTTAKQRLAKKNELKARGTLLMALSDKHQLKFNIHKDAKSIIESIEKRLQKLISQLEILGESISQEDINLKFLRSPLSKLNATIAIEEAILPGIAYHQGTTETQTLQEELFQWRSSSSSASDNEVAPCSKTCSKAYATLQSHYDKLIVDFRKSQIDVLSYKTCLKDNALVKLRKKFEKAKKERDELKLTLEKFQTSSKNLKSQIYDKIGLGYDSQVFDRKVLDCEELHSYESDDNVPTSLVNDRASVKPVENPKQAQNLRIDNQQSRGYDSQVFDRQVFDCDELNSYELDDNVPTSPVHDRYKSGERYHAVPHSYTGTFIPPKPDLVFNDAPNASKTVPDMVNVESSLTKPSKDLSKTLRPDAPIIEDWTSDSEDKSEIMSVPKQKEPSFVQTFEHVKTPRASIKPVELTKPAENLRTDNQKSRDCNYYEKQMVQKPVWNNALRVNHHDSARMSHPHSNRNVVPTAVLTRSGLVSLNAARHVSTVVPHTTVKRSPRPVKYVVHKAYSPIRRPINHRPTSKPSNFNQQVTTVKVKKIQVSHGLGSQKTLSFLFDVQGNPQGNPKGGKISGKDFDDVYFVKELKFSLFSVSKMHDKKNSVLFADTECVVLSFDFKLPDENHVLLRVPRENNMYNVDLKNVVPLGDLTCLFANVALDDPFDNAVSPNFEIGRKSSFVDPSQYPDDPDMPASEDIVYSDDEEDVGAEADFSNLETNIYVSPIPTTRVHKDHPVTHIIGELTSAPQTMSMARMVKEQGGLTQINDEDFHTCFMVYQMDFKSSFLYGTIKEEVYVFQPLGFKDPNYPDKVYKVVKALYGLHQAPRAWYETLANYLLENSFQRGKIDQTLFIKKEKGDILLVQVYVDDIIFGSTNKELCKAFEKLMKDKFQMSSMGELAFFLGLQVKQNDDGIFISHDKYVAEILRKFGITNVKSASTPMEIEKPLLKDPDGEDVDVHIYRKKVVITKDVICQDLRLNNADGVECLPTEEIFAELARMRYEKPPPKLTFYKAFFLTQWKFLIHTLGQCVSEKRTVWNEFSCSMASAVICLATGFDQVVDFLNAQVIQKKVVLTEDVIRQDLRLDDGDGVECLPNEEIFAELARIGYEKPPLKLTFYKAFFSGQWKFLIHTLVQCVSAKRTAWNKFSCSMASAVIYLATGVETPLFATMIFQAQTQAAEKEEEDEVPNAPTPPSPLQAQHVTPPPSPSQAQPVPPSSPPQEQPNETFESSMTLLNTLMEKGRIEAIDANKDMTLLDAETQVDLGAELQGRKDDDNAAAKEVSVAEPTVFDDEEVTMTMAQTLIRMKAKKARILDDQMAKRLHDEEVEQAAARKKQK
nr:copia protein [Tanacetum cinerariifolium]